MPDRPKERRPEELYKSYKAKEQELNAAEEEYQRPANEEIRRMSHKYSPEELARYLHC
jgi:adenylylsulfate kinase-like enzyme